MVSDDEARKLARALWNYTGDGQKAIEKALGWRDQRIKEMTRDASKSAPTMRELLELAAYAGVPRTIAIDGFVVADPDAQLRADLDALRGKVSAVEARLEKLSGVVARQGQELRADRNPGRRKAPAAADAPEVPRPRKARPRP